MTDQRQGLGRRAIEQHAMVMLREAQERVRVLSEALAGLYGLLQLYEGNPDCRLPPNWKSQHRAVAALAALEPPIAAGQVPVSARTGEGGGTTQPVTGVPDSTPASAAPLSAQVAGEGVCFNCGKSLLSCVCQYRNRGPL